MLSLLGAGQGQNISFDADYQAVLNYATSLGYTLPSADQRVKQNKLLVDLKSAGVWTKLDTFANFATDGSSNFALIDWKRLFLYTGVNSPTFTSNQGFTGNGTSSHVDTNFNPATSGVQYQLNNASRFIFMNLASGTGALDGANGSPENRMTRDSSVNHLINSGSNALNTAFNFTAVKGMKSIHRTSSTNVELFNGTAQGSRIATSTSIASLTQVILRNNGFGAHQISMYAMGASLVSENTNFVNAFNTYINSL